MKQSMFDSLVSAVSAKLRIMEEMGQVISNELIGKKIDDLAEEYRTEFNFGIEDDDVRRLKFHIGSIFNVRVGEASISLHNPELPRWFHSRKRQIEWNHWNAYKSMLESQGRPRDIVDANEEVIDDILDFSGDPKTPGRWSRKGLVMGNVQSGKTQNYIGLINKAIDCGYKTIILLGGHLNDLRRQTQERVDEGVLGRRSKHLADAMNTAPSPIGVGIFRENSINTGTTTVGDFNKSFADRLGFKLSGEDPVIFTIKKHTGVMTRLYEWIKEYHFLDPDGGKVLDGPLLLIDDEADYASINTKHHREEVTRTNEYIRELLSLFGRNTYVGYTATPFANIFIDPDDSTYSDKADLFPSDFMIRIPVPDNYLGQDYFFGSSVPGMDAEEFDFDLQTESPTVPIEDHWPIYELKSGDEIDAIPESLKEAFRAFILVMAVRALRGERNAHNTMLVNISHLKVHQDKLEFLVREYHKEVDAALESFAGLGVNAARNSETLLKLEQTFNERFSIPEEYQRVFAELREASGKIKVWAINQRASRSDSRELDYSVHKEHGLSVVVIGGHKLSRGLTLEGLSISYFARNSKAYDTLMQMCRWFGYRPGYSDLCRVYLPQESIDWYCFISSAIRELYQELELMSRREQRPSEFGLKVREHPGAMIITARNKMGAAESEVRSQDLWGQVQRRFRFFSDPEVNLRNVRFTRQFVETLLRDISTDEIWTDKSSRSRVFTNVSYEHLIEYIEGIDLPEDDLGNQALISHLRKMSESGLGAPRVVLFNQASTRMTRWEGRLSDAERHFINNEYQFSRDISLTLPKRRMDATQDFYKVRSVHLGNPDDERLFLSEAERDAVKRQYDDDPKRQPVSFDYLCAEERDYPGLIIYHFAVAVEDLDRSNPELPKNLRLGHGLMPTVGYTVSFPRPENLKGMSKAQIDEIVKRTKHSYQVNKVHSQLQALSAYEEFDDE